MLATQSTKTTKFTENTTPTHSTQASQPDHSPSSERNDMIRVTRPSQIAAGPVTRQQAKGAPREPNNGDQRPLAESSEDCGNPKTSSRCLVRNRGPSFLNAQQSQLVFLLPRRASNEPAPQKQIPTEIPTEPPISPQPRRIHAHRRVRLCCGWQPWARRDPRITYGEQPISLPCPQSLVRLQSPFNRLCRAPNRLRTHCRNRKTARRRHRPTRALAAPC